MSRRNKHPLQATQCPYCEKTVNSRGYQNHIAKCPGKLNQTAINANIQGTTFLVGKKNIW